MRHFLRTIAALTVVELRALRSIALTCGCVWIAVFAWLRFSSGVDAPLGSGVHAGLALLALLTLGVPILATVFAGTEAQRIEVALRPLPASGRHVFPARIAAAALASAFGAGLALSADVLFASVAGAGGPTDVGALLRYSEAIPALCMNGCAALAVSALAASIFRSALGAALLGASVFAWPLMALSFGADDRGNALDDLIGDALGFPMPLAFAWIGIGLALCAAARLRGPRVRSTCRRALAAGGVLTLAVLGAICAAQVSAATQRAFWPAPSWADEDASLIESIGVRAIASHSFISQTRVAWGSDLRGASMERHSMSNGLSSRSCLGLHSRAGLTLGASRA